MDMDLGDILISSTLGGLLPIVLAMFAAWVKATINAQKPQAQALQNGSSGNALKDMRYFNGVQTRVYAVDYAPRHGAFRDL
jgi:hypothetical protein